MKRSLETKPNTCILGSVCRGLRGGRSNFGCAQQLLCLHPPAYPLTYALRIGERIVQSDGRETLRQSKNESNTANFKAWPAYELFPSTPWNYGLMPDQSFELVEEPWPENKLPWTQEGTPVMLKAKARLIPG